jgi:class 3 adenylate cyclase
MLQWFRRVIFFQSRRYTLTQAVKSLELYGVNATVQQRFAAFLQASPGRSLHRANPRWIAEQLALSESEALRLLIAALNEGMMTLQWEIQCPQCSGVDGAPQQLRDLRTQHTCPFCNNVHDTNADDDVRVAFSVDQRLRKLKPSDDDPAFRARVDTHYGVVSGHQLLTIQLFRDLFPRETMPPHESLLIRRVTLLFTDLAGSTALYSRNGDPQAYSVVRQHFDLLFAIVDRHHGVVIKTIGDAVMAAFTQPQAALSAAISMQEQMSELNHRLNLSPDNRLILKVGLHSGPCISVTLNERVDYFGTTVNTAARVQSLSQGNDIVITETLLPEVTERVAANYACRSSRAVLKGLREPVPVYYLRSRLEAEEALPSPQQQQD